MPSAAPTHKRPTHNTNKGKYVVGKHNRDRRGTANERGYTYKWQQFTASHLTANPLCEYCLTQGKITPAQAVDHIEPHRGDHDIFWQEGNHASTCHPCHNGPKARAENIADKTGEPIREVLRRLGLLK